MILDRPELEYKEIREGVVAAFRHVVALLEGQHWKEVRELFREDVPSQEGFYIDLQD